MWRDKGSTAREPYLVSGVCVMPFNCPKINQGDFKNLRASQIFYTHVRPLDSRISWSSHRALTASLVAFTARIS